MRFAGCLIVALVLLVSTAHAQNDDGDVAVAEQTPGLLERIMTYVTPLREMNWRDLLRNALNSVMNYLEPDAKEPKAADDRAERIVREVLVHAVRYLHSYV